MLSNTNSLLSGWIFYITHKFGELRTDQSSGATKNVPADLDVRISIRTAKRHSVNGSLKYAAEC